MAPPLPNHLLSHRKRAALSQDELAFLLGKRGGEKVCRYERFARDPNLETLLAYEVVFGKPASVLFAGLYRKIGRSVVERARLLVHKTKRQKPGPMNKRKLEVLLAIIDKQSKKP